VETTEMSFDQAMRLVPPCALVLQLVAHAYIALGCEPST
jgi:hypothetical protein